MDISIDKLLYIFACCLTVVFLIITNEYLRGKLTLLYGDKTAYDAGKLSINPIRNICPIGTVLVPTVSFFISGFPCGWARTIPINYNNLNKQSIVKLALVGPLFFLFFSIIALTYLKFVDASSNFFIFQLKFSLTLLIFNLLPIYPMPMGRVLQYTLSENLYKKIQIPKRVGQGVLLVVILSGIIGYCVVQPILSCLLN